MESTLFPLTLAQIEAGTFDWTTGTIRAVVLPPGFAFDFYTEEYLSDIPAGVRIATSANIESREVVAGVFKGKPADFGIVSDTRFMSQVVLYRDTGNEATSQLIAHVPDEGLVGDATPGYGVRYFLYPDASFGGFFFSVKLTLAVPIASQAGASHPVLLSWVAPASSPTIPVSSYEVYRSVNGGVSTLIGTATGGATSYQDADVGSLIDDDVLTYSLVALLDVSAFEGAGETYAVYYTAEDIIFDGALIDPFTLAVTQPDTYDSVDLAWTSAGPDIDGYRIYVRVDGGAYSLLDTVLIGTTSYVDVTAYAAGAVLDYYVQAYAGVVALDSNVEQITHRIIVYQLVGSARTFGGNARIFRSTDGGDTWALETPSGLSTQTIDSIASSIPLNRIVGVQKNSDAAPVMVYSDDAGVTWNLAATPIPDGVTKIGEVFWSKASQKFICAYTGNSGGSQVPYYSTDGINWVAGTGSTFSSTWFLGIAEIDGVVYVFYSDCVVYSSDCINWTATGKTIGASSSSIAYSPTANAGGPIVTMVSGNTSPAFCTSGAPWNTSWTVGSPASNFGRPHAWSPDLNLFATSADTPRYSADGQSWSLGGTDLGGTYFRTIWSISGARFVSAGRSGTVQMRISYSTDGINWAHGYDATSGQVNDIVEHGTITPAL